MTNILTKVYNNERLSKALSIISHIISAVSVPAFLFTVGYRIYLTEYVTAAKLFLAAFSGFLLVTIARRLINAPRPYEIYGFYERKPKNKSGSSFPSRHAYSAFAIATLSISVNPILAGALFFFSVMLSVFRVLLGIHFVRDVLAGALLGTAAGAIGLLII